MNDSTKEDAIVTEQNAVARELRNALGYEDPDREPLPVTPALAFRLAEVAAMAKEVKRLRDERADMITEQQAALSGLMAERDAARKAAEELRLTLLAEQGNAEGAPSKGWRAAGGDWIKGRARARRTANGWWWFIYVPQPNDNKATVAEGRASTARAAMQAADHDLFESRQARCIARALKLKTDGVILWPPNGAHQQTPSIMLDRLTDPNLTEAVLAVYEALL